MKLTLIFALLTTTSAAAPVTEGCIKEKDDETNIGSCTCHTDCKMCGYGTDADMPTK